MLHTKPAVVPGSHDTEADVKTLYKAMKGFGTNEKALISVLCHRTSAQRAEIARKFKASHGKDLDAKLKSETSGDFRTLMMALGCPLADFLARELHRAVDGVGTNESLLIEILCTRTNEEIKEINAVYQRLYDHSLEKDIKGDVSGDFRHLLVALIQGQRDEHTVADEHKAKDDAERLYKAGEGRLGTDESEFISILATRSYPHLRKLMKEYEEMKGHSLIKAVKSEFSGDTEKAMTTILEFAENNAEFFAKKINESIKGLGTNEKSLNRLIVSRCDIDLSSIKEEYEKIYGRSLASDVAGDTSGDYKKALLALIG